MAKIAYNGMELDEVTEPQIFDPPKTMLVWGDCSGHVEDHVKKAEVVAILPRTALKYPIITEDDDGYEHGAFIPEKPKPRRATWKELAYWLTDGKGLVVDENTSRVDTGVFFNRVDLDAEVSDNLKVMRRDDTDWQEPTVDYLGLEEK